MQNTEMVKEIVFRAYNSFIDKYKELEYSSLYKDDIEDITNIYNILDIHINHIITLDSIEYYSRILYLSGKGATLIKNLNEKRGVIIEY